MPVVQCSGRQECKNANAAVGLLHLSVDGDDFLRRVKKQYIFYYRRECK